MFDFDNLLSENRKRFIEIVVYDFIPNACTILINENDEIEEYSNGMLGTPVDEQTAVEEEKLAGMFFDKLTEIMPDFKAVLNTVYNSDLMYNLAYEYAFNHFGYDAFDVSELENSYIYFSKQDEINISNLIDEQFHQTRSIHCAKDIAGEYKIFAE